MYALCNRNPFPVEYAAPVLPSLSPALDFLLELRLERGPLAKDEAYRQLDECWAARPKTEGS